MDKQEAAENLQELLEAYGSGETIQEPQYAATDKQLNSLALVAEDVMCQIGQGTVLDLGCGKGVFLSKLASLPSFRDNAKWNYLGAEHSNLHDSVLQLAASLRFHRRCDVIDLETLYNSWLQTVETPEPLLVIVRNVLHELRIPETAQLLHLLNEHLSPEDILLVQDLLVFPKAERGNVCWDTSCLNDVFDNLGFSTSLVTVPSRSGVQWFSAKITKTTHSKPLPLEEVKALVSYGRLAQLEKWRTADCLPLDHPDNRDVKVAFLDFDLQKVALYEQLDNEHLLSALQQEDKPAPNPSSAIQLALSTYDPSILDRDKVKLPSINNFRDRANSQDALESFLSSEESVVVIQGGTSCGKSVLVSHVLSRRARGRSVVAVDCETVGDIWPMLEQYLLSIGCRSSLDILSREKALSFKAVQDAIDSLVAKISRKSIVVFDHFEKLLDPNGQIMDEEIRAFLMILASANGAKVVITTRKKPQLHFLQQSVEVNTEQPPVGRFPYGSHVENLLDDYVDRTAIGLQQYPDELLEAIDRFPYLATLAGKLIAEAGSAAANDPVIQGIIKSYLYDELAKRIVTPVAKPALQLACLLRIPAPRLLFESVAGEDATDAAIETGLLFSIPDRYRTDLLTCASVLRDPETEFETMDDDDTGVGSNVLETHAEIARWYAIISQGAEGDPRWIREAHYHTLASGSTSELERFGSLYKAELFWAARTWFRRFRKYGHALEALLSAEGMGLRTYETRMLTASCCVRVGHREEGESRYRALIADFPNQEGVKTSFVDSLLSIGEFRDALDVLSEFGLAVDGSNPWVTGQYGRAYLGQHKYAEATKTFFLQLKKYARAPAIVYVRLAQSYFRLGQRTEARATVDAGLKVRPDNPALNTLHCANLIRSGSQTDLEDAQGILNDFADEYPRNGYILQKLITVSALLGDAPKAIARLEQIQWRVEPPHLDKPVRITVFLAQKQFRRALEIVDSLSTKDEYGQATMRKIYLSWAKAEQTGENRRRVAELALEREIPESCKSNVPILTMCAQLARIAGDNDRFDRIVDQIRMHNPDAAEVVAYALDVFDSWEDFEPEVH